jgi:polar amino acid transport system substrate-binding protein
MKYPCLARLIPLACLCLPVFAAAEETVTLSYNERPPYLIPAPDGSATGLTGTPAAQAFKAAGIAVTWPKVPTTRQMALVKDAGMNCAIGWFKNPEREQFAKFTKAIYRDKPWIVLANKGFSVQDGAKLENVLSMKGVRVLTKEAFSYGPYIDGLLAKTKPNITVSNGTTTQMLQLINANSVDFRFVSEEEAEYLVEQAGLKMANFRQLKFPDMPAGDKRYIMCSKHVPDEVISKVNKAITFE